MNDMSEIHYQVIEQFRQAWFPEGNWEVERLVSSGFSEAIVILLNITRKGQGAHGEGGWYFLKIYKPNSWGEKEESQRLLEVLQVTKQIDKDFAEKYIINANLAHSINFMNEKIYGLLFPVAGNSSRYFQPADGARNKAFIKNASFIASKLMTVWTHAETDQEPLFPHQFLERWLGYRLDAEQAGDLHKLVSDTFENEPQLTVEKSSLINPLEFYEHLKAESRKFRKIHPLVGVLHMDLHGGNLFLDVRDNGKIEESFKLIDFGLSVHNGLIGFDHAYLEVSQCLYNLELVDVERFIKLLEALDGKDSNADYDISREERYVLDCLREIRSGINEWRENFHTMVLQENVNDQMLLARVAAGVNWANKKIDQHKRKISLLYAAYSARKFLREQELYEGRSDNKMGLPTKQGKVTMLGAANNHIGSRPIAPSSSLLSCFLDLVRTSHTENRPVMTISTHDEYAKFAGRLLDINNISHLIWIVNGSPIDVPQDELDGNLLSSWDVRFSNCTCQESKLRVVIFNNIDEIVKYLDSNNHSRRTAFEGSCIFQNGKLFFSLIDQLPKYLSRGNGLDLGYVESIDNEGRIIFHSPFGTSASSSRYSPVIMYPRSLNLGSRDLWNYKWHGDLHSILDELASRVELVNALRDEVPERMPWLYKSAEALLEFCKKNQTENGREGPQ